MRGETIPLFWRGSSRPSSLFFLGSSSILADLGVTMAQDRPDEY